MSEEFFDDNDEESLFGNWMARNSDPDTSHDAADSVELARDRAEAFEHACKMIALSASASITRKEFRDTLIEWGFTTLRAESLRRRITDLVKILELLVATGEVRDGSEVLVLTDEGDNEILVETNPFLATQPI
jgi:thioredoxin-like negative regulator of GroEL